MKKIRIITNLIIIINCLICIFSPSKTDYIIFLVYISILSLQNINDIL
jgi:hypothetical protein